MTPHRTDRRGFIGAGGGTLLALGAPWMRQAAAERTAAGEPVPLGGRRELFVDDLLIDRLDGAALRLHRPQPRDVVFTCDAPWEGNTSAYYSLLRDGDVVRMYYRGSHFDETTKQATHPEVTCCAESRDGLTFSRPRVGRFEFQESTDNNIVWAGDGATHNFAPFLDGNPACPAAARYKALGGGTTLVGGKKKACLYAFQSADGLHWSRLSDAPVITAGAFDSQNIAFWDDTRGEYRAYWRYFSAGTTDERGWKPAGVRAIRTATSRDFLHWHDQADLRYGEAPPEHLYTNAIRPYLRAPHLFIGFPTRFQPRTQQVEPVFMSSRDGLAFRRSAEELIPITAPQDRDGNRANYMTNGLLQLQGEPGELSVYATERYYTGPGSRVRRFTFRLDGFMSVHAPATGTLVTRPLVFAGSRLSLNLASRGSCRIELQDGGGAALPGFALDDCTPAVGDSVDHVVTWRGGELSRWAGTPVRLRFVFDDVDLYALQFQGAA